VTGREQLLLERYRLGELPAEKMKEVEAMAGFEEAMREMDESDRLIRENLHFSAVEGKIKSRRRTGLYQVLGVAASLLMFIGMGWILVQGSDSSLDDATRVKGAPALTIYRNTGDAVEKLSDGADAFSGDLLQIAYRNIPQDKYGMIISLDGNGNQTIHYPLSGDTSQLLESGGEVYLPWSYELDNAPDYEAFFLIVSNKSFSMKDISITALMEERMPRGVDVYGVLLNKRD